MKKLIGLIIIVLLGIAAFVLFKQKAPISEPVGLANPASVNCLDNGGTLEIVDTTGGQVGMCTLVDGTVCEERAYFRGECGGKIDNSNVTDFQSCIDAGNPAMESYPRQCTANGETFTEVINEDPIACTMEYAPVCASVAVQCITTPCDPIEQTFGNRCMMNANKLATFLHDGECETK